MKNIFRNNNYRFGLETSLLMYLDQYQFVLGSDLEDFSKRQTIFDDDNPCNIYFILRRPKITVDPNSIEIDGKIAKFNLLIHIQENVNVVNMSCEFLKATSKIQHFTEYPYNMLAFRDQEQILMVARPSVLIDSHYMQNNIETEDLDYEVLYIGQAYGKNGNRTAMNRLSSHDTLQKIYADSLTKYPDSDIWIMLTNFSQQSILAMAGADLIKVADEDAKIEKKKLKHITKNNGLKFSEKQKINFTEASLIKYFQPKYNIEFKDTFPNQKHKSYSECYKLDINSMVIELETSEMQRMIFTEKSGRKVHHVKTFNFTSDEDRFKMLNFE